MKIARRVLLSGLASSILLGGTACSSSAPGQSASMPAGDKVTIVVSIYPFAFVAERVAGAHASIETLTPAGVDAHEYELTPRQIAGLNNAHLVVYQKGFSAAMDAAMEKAKPRETVETGSTVTLRPVGDGHTHEGKADSTKTSKGKHGEYGYDPHVWLDPKNVITITNVVTEQIVRADPKHADDYRANAKKVNEQLTQLDKDFSAGLSSCERKTFIPSHAAFGYLADAYGLTQISISGLSPEAVPSPARMAELREQARKHGLTTIFYETLVSPELSQSLARDLGLATDVLDPVAGLSTNSRGSDYLEIMRANLAALKKANGCA